jgi:hydrogenase/urease accessory protein HupE
MKGRATVASSSAGHRQRIGTLVLASASAWLWPTPALAHGGLAIGDFYTGMLHPLLHFEVLLPTLALSLWAGQLGGSHAWRLPLVFLGAALLGAAGGLLDIELRLGSSLLRLSMLMFGLLAAARGRLPAVVGVPIVLLVGIYLGQANTFEPDAQIERPLLFVAGLGSCIGLILFHVVSRVARYRAFWVQTGVRVAGSWIAATGLLVLALEWAVQR